MNASEKSDFDASCLANREICLWLSASLRLPPGWETRGVSEKHVIYPGLRGSWCERAREKISGGKEMAALAWRLSKELFVMTHAQNEGEANDQMI